MLDELISPVQFPAGSTLYPVPMRGRTGRGDVLTALITAVPATVAACTGLMAWKAQRDTPWSPAAGNGHVTERTTIEAAIGELVAVGDIDGAKLLRRKWNIPATT